MKLDKEDILDTAFALLEDRGIDQFNLRALAARLSVSATALYWHFSDKGELLWAMSGRIYEKAYAVLNEGGEWQQALRRFALALKDSIGTYRDAARLCILAKPATPDPYTENIDIARPLEMAGLSRRDALDYEAALISYVLGWSIFHQNPAMQDFLSERLDYESNFHVGLDAMLRGFSEQQRGS